MDKQMETKIEFILKHFNFNNVRLVMEALNWTWNKNTNVPSHYELIETAKTLLKDAVECKGTASTGGFEATYYEDGGKAELSLAFIAENENSECSEEAGEA